MDSVEKKKQYLNTRQIVALCLMVLALSSTGWMWLIVQANPVSPNVYLNDLPSQATYTVKTDGVNYWAVRYDGYIAYESTNATYVIQSVWSAITEGTIYFKAGTYNSAYLLSFSGATKKVKIMAESLYSVTLRYTGGVSTGSFITVGDVYSFSMENMNIQGNGNVATLFNSTGITNADSNSYKAMVIKHNHFNDSSDGYAVSFYEAGSQSYLIEFENNRVERFGSGSTGGGVKTSLSDGQFFDNIISNGDGLAELYISPSGGNRIRGNYLGGTADNGLYIWSSYNIATGNFIDHHDKEGLIIRSGHGNTITGNTIRNSAHDNDNLYSSIKLMSTGAANNTITGNMLTQDDPSGYNTKYGIQEVSPASMNLISGNTINGFQTNPFSINATTVVGFDNLINSKPIINLGSGVNATATTYVFTHGLYSTPNFVQASFNSSAITGFTWVATSTTVTITVAGTLPAVWATYVTAYWKP